MTAPPIQAIIDECFLDESEQRRDLPQPARWFGGGAALDERLRTRWSDSIDAAMAGSLDHCRDTAEGSLAFVLLLDQFARNVHRGSAREHAVIVERFGRYPHRNEVLGRTSTDEERAWLDEGGGRFGQ